MKTTLGDAQDGDTIRFDGHDTEYTITFAGKEQQWQVFKPPLPVTLLLSINDNTEIEVVRRRT